jgi:hypothetical protein
MAAPSGPLGVPSAISVTGPYDPASSLSGPFAPSSLPVQFRPGVDDDESMMKTPPGSSKDWARKQSEQIARMLASGAPLLHAASKLLTALRAGPAQASRAGRQQRRRS